VQPQLVTAWRCFASNVAALALALAVMLVARPLPFLLLLLLVLALLLLSTSMLSSPSDSPSSLDIPWSAITPSVIYPLVDATSPQDAASRRSSDSIPPTRFFRRR
jgi:di/tricarboxylate transporter